MTEINIRIGGSAGQGLNLSVYLLGKTFVRSGYYVFTVADAMSRIRGGHNFFQMRCSYSPVAAMTEGIDILVAFDGETVERHRPELGKNGLIVLDSEALGISKGDSRFVDLPMKKLIQQKSLASIFSNSLALGFISGILGLDLETLQKLFEENFTSADLVAKNQLAAETGSRFALANYPSRIESRFEKVAAPSRLFLSGNEAIGLGALAADCRFMSAYPMSPSTSIMTYLASTARKSRIVVEQAEDEIAAVNLAFGASMAGVRSMTATSGGGMALMSETISLAGAAEVPLVIVDCQRPGPATGLPTRTEQGDLLFAIHTGHGEFARAVLAPGNAANAFQTTIDAFNYADLYQIPVVVLADQYLSDSYYTVDPFDLSEIRRETSLLGDEELSRLDGYKRYQITESGISPRAYPGQSRHLVFTDSHEHDETGHITEEASLREKMVKKRLSRNESIVKKYSGPQKTVSSGTDAIVVGWGSTQDVIFEAVSKLGEEGVSLEACHFVELWPFPVNRAKSLLGGGKRIICVEGNATGQLAGIIRQMLGHVDLQSVTRYDGRPFSVGELATSIREAVER